MPGSPLDPRAEGTNSLIKQGATLITEAADVIAALEPILGQEAPPPAGERDNEDLLPPHQEPANSERERIIGLLGATPVELDDLVRLSGSSPAIVRTILLELELAGRIARHSGGLISLV